MTVSFRARQQGGGDFKPLAAGVYAGVCTALVDIGIQPGGRFKDSFKVLIGFELPDAPARDDGQPQMIYLNVTNSMDKKANLRKQIESWFGRAFQSEEQAKDFDLSKLLGKTALVNVKNDERNGKVYANIAGLTPLMAGMTAPVAKTTPLIYVEELPLPERSRAYAALPPWIQKKVDEQIRPEPEAAAGANAAVEGADAGDDIPF